MPIQFALDQLCVSYDSLAVLKGVSFEVGEGEFVGIVGPNGSGKSTLLRAMTGVLGPVSGSARLDGHDLSRTSGRELAHRIAVVPQEAAVAFDFTVLEVVLMGRSPYLGRFRIEGDADVEIALAALERTNLTNLAERRADELSGGERQRMMIARGLAQQTGIILLDEPTAHLDINYQVEILHLLKRENADHRKTVVVVLHDLNLAAEFCDRLIMLHDGTVYADGTPDEVITAANVQAVYGAAVWVRKHPTSGRPYVLSIGSRGIASRLANKTEDAGGLRVHVICGGGSGMTVFAALLEAGCEVTAGVINIGDTDQEAAESLGIEYVEESPFSPISEAAEQANLRFISEADGVVIADVPFGVGNLANLRCAEWALEAGQRVAVVGDPSSYDERDFAGGEVSVALSGLVEHGAVAIASPDDVARWIAESERA